MKVTYTNGGILKAPKNGLMNREITESIHGIMKVRLSDKKGQVLYEGIGTNTGVEIAPYLRRCSF